MTKTSPACIIFLLQLEHNVDNERLAELPLCSTLPSTGVNRAKFGDVISWVQEKRDSPSVLIDVGDWADSSLVMAATVNWSGGSNSVVQVTILWEDLRIAVYNLSVP